MSSNIYDETKIKMPEFANNKAPREGFNVVFIFSVLVIILTVGLTVGTIWTCLGFDSSPETKYFDPDDGGNYKSYKTSLEAALGMCVTTCILLAILVIIYFVYLEEGFTFSERLSNNLAVATQGPDRLRKVSGLLSGFVYPGQANGAQRRAYANTLEDNLRKTYFNENRLRKQQYNDADLTRLSAEYGAGEEYTPGQPVNDYQRQVALLRRDRAAARAAARAAGGYVSNKARAAGGYVYDRVEPSARRAGAAIGNIPNRFRNWRASRRAGAIRDGDEYGDEYEDEDDDNLSIAGLLDDRNVDPVPGGGVPVPGRRDPDAVAAALANPVDPDEVLNDADNYNLPDDLPDDYDDEAALDDFFKNEELDGDGDGDGGGGIMPADPGYAPPDDDLAFLADD